MKLRKSSFARFQQQIAFEQQQLEQAQFFANNNDYNQMPRNYWTTNPRKEITWDKYGWPSQKNIVDSGMQRQMRPSGRQLYPKFYFLNQISSLLSSH